MSLIQATEVRAHRFPRQLAVLALVLVTMQSSGHADETAAEPAASRGAVGTAYCGLHCVYGAVRLSQPDAAFDRILKPDFINGTFGSSSENLIDAFAEFGIHAEFDPALALGRLQALNRPAILHVRPVGRRVYSHWILFLGFDGEEIRIYDPPQEQTRISVTDLLSVWSGGAVIPDLPASSQESLVAGNLLARLPVSLSVVGMIAISLSLTALLHRTRTITAFAAAVVGVALFTHVALRTGFVHGSHGIGAVQASYFQRDIPTIDFETTKSLCGKEDVVFVDARTVDAYDRFHLPNAVNIPVDSTFCQLINSMKLLKPDSRIIFYCQSEHCQWADSVANQIVNRGISNVAIYRGGVREWQSKHGK